MRSRSSRFNRRASFVIGLVGFIALSAPKSARAQACCAGGSVITPGRLSLHDDALVGVQVKAGLVAGSYDVSGRFLGEGSGESELDLEQDLFGAVRVLQRGQVALLVPLVETRRTASQPAPVSQMGGGIGDVNASVRYDLVRAGEARFVPGIALLAGVTFPSGRPPEQATPPLEANATGIGAFQFNGALALEQIMGPWLVNATGIVAKRTEHGGETLGTQVTLLAAGAYTFPNDASVALSASYAFEGDATSGGADVPNSGKSVTTVTLSGLWPLTDTWRLILGLYTNPPVHSLGTNQPAVMGATLTAIVSWM